MKGTLCASQDTRQVFHANNKKQNGKWVSLTKTSLSMENRRRDTIEHDHITYGGNTGHYDLDKHRREV